MRYVEGVQKAFLTTKGMKGHENFEGKLMSQPDTSSLKFAFVAFGLNYDKISEDYDHHTNPTLKKFVLFRAFRG